MIELKKFLCFNAHTMCVNCEKGKIVRRSQDQVEGKLTTASENKLKS